MVVFPSPPAKKSKHFPTKPSTILTVHPISFVFLFFSFVFLSPL